MMKKVVVLISGKQGSGKTTLSHGLQAGLNDISNYVYPIKFAGALYQMHDMIRRLLREYNADNMPEDLIDGPLLQLLGTEWGRNTRGQDFWVRIARGKVESISELLISAGEANAAFFVIDDARFENEIRAFDDCGYITFKIRLEAPEYIRQARADKWRENTGHTSEVGLDEYFGWDLKIDCAKFDKDEVLHQVLSFVKEKV